MFDVLSSDEDPNTVEVKDQHIRIKKVTNCADQNYLQFGLLSSTGETAVCSFHISLLLRFEPLLEVQVMRLLSAPKIWRIGSRKDDKKPAPCLYCLLAD